AGEDARVSVGSLREKEQERKREVENDEGGADPTPAAGEPPQIPRDLLREVAGPDDQVLRERDIAPEHDEGEKKLPEVVVVRRPDEIGIRPLRRHQDQSRRDERER